MNTTELKRDKLLEILKENRAKHIKAFDLAVEHRRMDVIEKLPMLLKEFELKTRDLERIDFPLPKSSETEYNTIIRKMELDVRETIELDDRQFQNWVMDRWVWSDNFMRTSATYALGKI